jgi:serine/threonine-protein kinase
VLPKKADHRPQRRIGRYLVTGRIGRGGMGMVYRGLDPALEREVAVKTLTAEGTLDEESRRRFAVEAKAAAKLQHRNIVTVFELGEDRGVPFIAMEMLPGVDLEALVRSGEEMLLAEKLEIVIQVCRGLAFAHEHRIVHRDVKPSNIRLLDDGTVKIMDFGIAKLGGTQLTKAGMMVGTVHYMSPEQVRGKPLDGRSDVFSLGVILYELLAGRRPFKGEGATDVLFKIVNDDPAPLDPGPLGGVSPRLQEVVSRALAKNLEDRYPTAAALAEDLAEVMDAHVRTLGIGAPPPATLEAIASARRLVKEGRVPEGERRLREIATANPWSVDARRALRAALREEQRSRKPAEAASDDYPELEATFQAPPTQRTAETQVLPNAGLDSAPPGRGTTPVSLALWRPGRGLWLGLGAAGLFALAAAFLLARGGFSPAPAEVRVPVRSQPFGAAVLLDGKDTGVVTNGELVLRAPLPPQVVLTFRKAGHQDETRTVQLPLPAGASVSVTLMAASAVLPVASDPPGATVTLDGQRQRGVTPLELTVDPSREHVLAVALEGHGTQEVRLPPRQMPAEVKVKLEPAGPLGTVVVASSYPVDVLWRGRVLAKEQAGPRVSLPGGRQTLTLVSSPLFLRRDLQVSVTGGVEVAVEAPGVGKINIRALPDNCQVFIDGAFVDYPPVLDRAIVEGAHTVGFKWPDGAKSQETVEVPRGAPAFVTGRRE